MKIALATKRKLGFINGKIKQPSEDPDDFEDWCGANAMVISWILSSLSKDLHEAFVYATSAKELGDRIEQRFSESNGPLRYHIKREIASITQGNDSVSMYFTKLSKLWDELNCVVSFPHCTCGCTCGASKEVADINESDKAIQFLMGLNEAYDNVRNQILILEPIPNIDKIYSMILNVEKQK